MFTLPRYFIPPYIVARARGLRVFSLSLVRITSTARMHARKSHLLASTLLLSLLDTVGAFQCCQNLRFGYTLWRAPFTTVAMADSSDEAREEIRAMRVKQIKAELEALSVPHADVLEKEDLVQRLMDARQVDRSEDGQGEDGADSSAKPPSMGETMRQADILMADAEGPEVMAALQKDPRLMKAVMDISMNGDASKYADDAEVMALMRKLEGITKRGMASSQEYNPFPDNA